MLAVAGFSRPAAFSAGRLSTCKPMRRQAGRLLVQAATSGGAAVPGSSHEDAPQQASSKPCGKALGRVPGQQAKVQQTLRRSFTVGGIGLHTGEFAVVRVAPAFAGEGRYFVRMPSGAISPQWNTERPTARQLDDVGSGARSPPADRASAETYINYIERVESGDFVGTFSEYMQQFAAPQLVGLADTQSEQQTDEQPSTGHAGETRLPAHVDRLQEGHHWCTVLGEEGAAIWGTEHLLAALECCGVHNARIEVEGGKEVPIIDGSALGWASEILRAGVQVAHDNAGTEPCLQPTTSSPQQVLTVQEGESFISFYPGPTARVTVGIDHSTEAPVIGQQWFSWSPDDGTDDFVSSLAPARTCYASLEQVLAIRKEGLLQAGPDYVSIVGNKEDWLEPHMVRFPADEAARHAVVALLGDLSLLAWPGGSGTPVGHVLAYQPSAALRASFCKRFNGQL